MLVNASRVAVRDCCTRLLYSGGSVGECCESHCSTHSLYSGGNVGECCRSHCSTHSLYSGSQYTGGHCTLEVALVNAVGYVCCTLAVSTLMDAVIWKSCLLRVLS